LLQLRLEVLSAMRFHRDLVSFELGIIAEMCLTLLTFEFNWLAGSWIFLQDS